MPAWGNTDAHNQKPKWDLIRETRENFQFQVLTGNTAGNTVIQVAYNDGGQNNVANVGVTSGLYVYFMANGFNNPGGTAGNGYPSMFFSNTTIASTSGNTITLATALFGNVSNTFGVEFDKTLVYNTNKPLEANTGADTILVTATRAINAASGHANSAYSLGNWTVGWNKIQKKVNNDGTVRYLKETLVALSSPTAANTNSGNTSWGQAVTGL